MMLPALELYSNGLLTDPGLYQAFLARAEETGGIA